jgi:hypothetical protein
LKDILGARPLLQKFGAQAQVCFRKNFSTFQLGARPLLQAPEIWDPGSFLRKPILTKTSQKWIKCQGIDEKHPKMNHHSGAPKIRRIKPFVRAVCPDT